MQWTRRQMMLALGSALLAPAAAPAEAAELQARTVTAFDRYVRLTEARMAGSAPFLWLDGLTTAARAERLTSLTSGGLIIEPLTTREAGRDIDVPGGLVHHWLGAVFVPRAGVDDAVALLQDYNQHARIYAPNVAASKLLTREGDHFTVYLRFAMSRVITVVVNSEHDARFTRHAADRASSRIKSTRIAEVENPDTDREREKPVGEDGGYLWRLYSYWRFLERDGGVHVQCESISLTRGIPTGLGWAVGPFVTSIPRDSLTLTLERTRQRLLAA